MFAPPVALGSCEFGGVSFAGFDGVGDGSVDVFAAHDGNTYTTRAEVHGLRLQTFEIGHTLPQGATLASVTIDGHPVAKPDVRQTNRGLEVSVPVSADGAHTLTHTLMVTRS